MKNESLLGTMLTLLLISTSTFAFNIHPARAQSTPTISVRNPQTGTPNFILYTNTTTIGSRFNVTVDINQGTDIAGWQVYMSYNATLLNATGAWAPSKDLEYIFHGKDTYAPPPTFYPYGVKFGEITVPLFGASFTTTKKLAIIEFEVLAEPPKGIGNNISTTLGINYPEDTYILNSLGDEISSSKTDGYYELNWAEKLPNAQPPNPPNPPNPPTPNPSPSPFENFSTLVTGTVITTLVIAAVAIALFWRKRK